MLNLSFAGFYGGANTGFSFKLEAVTRTDNAYWFTMSDFATRRREVGAPPGLGPNALNIYIGTTAGGTSASPTTRRSWSTRAASSRCSTAP